MGRVAEGWKLVCRRGVYGIRWRNISEGGRKRTEVSLRTTDILEATRLAPKVYADHVAGTPKTPGDNAKVHPAVKLKPLIVDWLEAIQAHLGTDTDKTYIIYGNHWLKHIKMIGDVRSAKIDDYQNARLRVVQADTVRLEISAMRRFFKWLKTHEYIHQVPEFPEIGPKVLGTKFAVRRRCKPTEVFTKEQTDEILDAMPEMSERKRNGKHFPVRSRFVVAWETGLRPKTIDGLIAKDLVVSGLHIRPENDKNRWERVVPLTDAARSALESVLPGNPDAPIFGRHEWRKLFEKAVLEALGPGMADKMTPYDLKHGRVTELFDQGASELGIQFLTGTVSAIRKYAHPTRKAAEEAIGGRTGDKASGGRKKKRKTS